jgi:hypothetical protein
MLKGVKTTRFAFYPSIKGLLAPFIKGFGHTFLKGIKGFGHTFFKGIVYKPQTSSDGKA